MSRRLRCAPRRGLRRTVLAFLAFSTVGTAAGNSTASADPLADAKAQAAALQTQVTSLQTKAEVASEKYDAAESALGVLVVKERQAEIGASDAQATLQAAQAVVANRARALYMSGGTFEMYASVFDGTDPGQLASGLHDVQTLSDADHHALGNVDVATQAARTATAKVADLVAQQDRLTANAEAASDDAKAALDAQAAALDQANGQVRTLEAQLQAQIDARNAALAAAALAAAQQAAAGTGLVVTDASALARAAISAASTQLGKPYVFGGSGPAVWDCSGLTQWAYRQAGIGLPRTAAEQYAAMPTKIGLGQLAPGDLLFWATDPNNAASIHHVAIYLGNGQMLAAPHTGTVVQIQPVYLDGYYGAVRPA